MASQTSRKMQELSTSWQVKQTNLSSDDAWMPVHKVPTEVHLDLFNNNKIPDPFTGLNELASKWVADKSWTYRTTFATPDEPVDAKTNVDLVFQGLDTFTVVSLNGQEILRCNNMFIEYRVDVKDLLVSQSDKSRTNILEILFESARQKGLEIIQEHPEHRFIVHQTEISRGPVRKAQYTWGWDWGPILLGCGPWKPILLDVYETRLDDFWVDYSLDEDFRRVRGKVSAKVEGNSVEQIKFKIQYEGTEISSGELQKSQGSNNTYISDIEIADPKLCWPNGHGKQSRYQIEILVRHQNCVMDHRIKFIGFRRTQLVRDSDAFGTSFYFRINDIDIFAGGSCWIPADSFVSQISKDRYRDWIQLMRDGNQNMLRIWGGGIYEADALYDACDEFGILVWQDFMFACASYPTYPEYLQSVETEARCNLRRLRHHPSIVLWCGNNEDYQLIERYGLEYEFEEDKDPNSWLKSTFPARHIYEHLLPTVVEEEIPNMIYHPSSPWGNGTSTTLAVDSTVGDIHQWNVWHGSMEPYQKIPNMGGRFVSEFGMEAFPHLYTLRKMSNDGTLPSQMVLDFHNKAINHHRRIMTYCSENFSMPYASSYDDYLSKFTHLTQTLQAETMSLAYKSWRKDFGCPEQRKCGGALVWQLNDCWPTISWAIIDYYLVPKPAYYAIKHALAPLAVGVRRTFQDWTIRKSDALWNRDTGHVDPSSCLTGKGGKFNVWVASSCLDQVEAKVKIQFVSVTTGRKVAEDIDMAAAICPNQTTNLIEDEELPSASNSSLVNGVDGSVRSLDPYVIQALLYTNGSCVSEDTSWPEPFKYLDFSARNVVVQYDEDRKSIKISAEKPVKGFVFAEKPDIRLSDNGFDVMPGQEKRVIVTGTKVVEELDWNFVGKDV